MGSGGKGRERAHRQRRRVVGLAENAGRMPGVELLKPRNLCVCVSDPQRGACGQ